MQISRRSLLAEAASVAGAMAVIRTASGRADEAAPAQNTLPAPPARLVVLTFDDSAKSHFTIARSILKDYGFGATFFITEGFDFRDNHQDYMTWDEILQLHDDGFEIGNHTRDHIGITDGTVNQLPEQLGGIVQRCETFGIPQPVTFAWPGNAWTAKAFPILREHGILFARRGGAPEFPYEEGRGVAMQPGGDHPLLLPSAGDARPTWTLGNFIQAVRQAQPGRPAILQYHGVPDTAHAWVSSTRETFTVCMKYLHAEKYTVVALRDLRKWVNPEICPADPQAIIHQRKQRLQAGESI